ncbi:MULTISPECIES: glycosyltransferase [Cyanophyceae]|uniref:glycosyltransferase n=1 Tax=Cyanophyceae TaxID=3028117 RepID=UPI001686F5C9|nr:glycosyltransferase family 2 protein [Trichocoleus sp. FACHB-69]MBD1933043.1 glycosyltransferase family 2 protein [Trichocoleus sp. FACHB-69]
MSQELSIGIVIPSYNEGQDLVNTLKTIFNQSSPFTEVIVVDDSSDGTDRLVADTFGERVKLIHRDRALGRSSARNVGVQRATSDVVVILNADVSLPHNFCEQVKQKYTHENCDALGVELVVTNIQHPYPRYRYAMHLTYYTGKGGWTEGFSVRREAFLKTNGFPDGYILPILAGEDVKFVRDLERTGAKICFDYNLKVSTVTPEDAAEITSQLRGRASLRTLYFVYDKSWVALLLRCLFKHLRRIVVVGTVIPVFCQVFWLWVHFNHGWQDLAHYAKYVLYEKWLRSRQEWLDLAMFFKLYRQKGFSVVDIIFKRPSQLIATAPVHD